MESERHVAMYRGVFPAISSPGATNAAGLPVVVTGSVNTNSPGNYLLTYNATNSLGGSGTTRTITVQASTLTLGAINGTAYNFTLAGPGLLALNGTINSNVGILTVAGYFQLFAEPYVMTQGGPLRSTFSMLYLMYEEGFRWWNLGNASAVAFLLFVVIFCVSWVMLRFDRDAPGRR